MFKRLTTIRTLVLTILSLAFLISAFAIATSWSPLVIVVTSIVIATTGVLPLAFGWNEAMEAKWTVMKTKGFVIAYRSGAVFAILVALYLLLRA